MTHDDSTVIRILMDFGVCPTMSNMNSICHDQWFIKWRMIWAPVFRQTSLTEPFFIFFSTIKANTKLQWQVSPHESPHHHKTRAIDGAIRSAQAVVSDCAPVAQVLQHPPLSDRIVPVAPLSESLVGAMVVAPAACTMDPVVGRAQTPHASPCLAWRPVLAWMT